MHTFHVPDHLILHAVKSDLQKIGLSAVSALISGRAPDVR
jgi:hypothetical protein